MSNRELKEKLWQADNRCYWCNHPTKLLSIPEIKGQPDPLLATIDHLRSRYDLTRFIKPKSGEKTKVLACYRCNSRRAKEETNSLSREELVKRSQGFSLNPRGKPIIVEGLSSLDEVIGVMRKKLPGFEWYEKLKSQRSFIV